MNVKKELIGNFYRSGKLYSNETIGGNALGFISQATGKFDWNGL